ncbi:hypothetical protein ACFVFH_11785 [Streptomyces sp. NPDC057697]|uniref:hypothetical protein n=1 Tax=Streptomyces sp. NPDC057697 TaxID=3346219 RepID=UPI00369D5612
MTMRTIITSRIAAVALAGAFGFGAVSYATASHTEANRRTVAYEFECNAESCNPSSCNWIWGSYPGTGSGC